MVDKAAIDKRITLCCAYNKASEKKHKLCGRRVRLTRYAPARLQEPNITGLYIIIIIKNEKTRVTLCENAAGALYIVNIVDRGTLSAYGTNIEVRAPFFSVDMIHFLSQQ